LLLCGLLVNICLSFIRPPDFRQQIWMGEISYALLLMVGNMCLRWRLTRPSVRSRIIRKVEARTLADPRDPVLYLREFGQDAVLATAEALDVAMVGSVIPRLRPLTIEQNLQVALSFVGPVYALRDPRDSANDLIPPQGICRFFAGADWKSDVRDRMLKSSIVALIPGTEFTSPGEKEKGFVWEIRELLRLGLLKKTVIFIPSGKRYYDRFCAEMRERGIFHALPEFREPKHFRNKGPIHGLLYFDEACSPRLQVIGDDSRKLALWRHLIPYLWHAFDHTGRQWRGTMRKRVFKNVLLDCATFACMLLGGIMVASAYQLISAGLA
jgi:hypothetical protein